MPQTDFIKLIASHAVAVILSVGGPILLVWIWAQPALDGKDGIMAMVGGFVGFAIQFLFQTNTQGATRAQTRNDLMTPSGDVPGGS